MEDFEKADSSAGNQLQGIPLTISMEFWWYKLFEVFWDIFREMSVRDCKVWIHPSLWPSTSDEHKYQMI
jgi:hypothetical protein